MTPKKEIMDSESAGQWDELRYLIDLLHYTEARIDRDLKTGRRPAAGCWHRSVSEFTRYEVYDRFSDAVFQALISLKRDAEKTSVEAGVSSETIWRSIHNGQSKVDYQLTAVMYWCLVYMRRYGVRGRFRKEPCINPRRLKWLTVYKPNLWRVSMVGGVLCAFYTLFKTIW